MFSRFWTFSCWILHIISVTLSVKANITASDSPATANEGQSIRKGRWCCIKKIFTATAADCGSYFLACAEISLLNLTFRRLEKRVLSAREKESSHLGNSFFVFFLPQNAKILNWFTSDSTVRFISCHLWQCEVNLEQKVLICVLGGLCTSQNMWCPSVCRSFPTM